jgi:hypothetical protein
MDINQSPLSRYKSNKPGIARSVTDTKTLSEASKAKEASASQSAKQPDIKEGQLVKGQIVDLRYNEVRIQLEPGEQVINARLSGGVPLAIGQRAQFLVTEEAPDHLVLKYLPEETAPTDAAIQKALTASGLPMTNRNISLVSELLDHRMSIDKQTLQALARLSVANREASPLTLVLMYKHRIPMTSSNIRQFEAYQNGIYRLLNDIRALSNNIPELLKTPGDSLSEAFADQAGLPLNPAVRGQSPPFGAEAYPAAGSDNELQNPPGNQLREAAPDSGIGSALQEAISINGRLIDILYPAFEGSDGADAGVQPDRLLSREELAALAKVIGQKLTGGSAFLADIPPDMAGRLDNGPLSFSEAARLIASLSTGTDKEIIPQIFQEMPEQLRTEAGNEASAVLAKLLKQNIRPQDTSPVLSQVLSPAQRMSLLQYIAGAPDIESLKEAVAQGTISAKEMLAFIREALPAVNRENAGGLVHSPEYARLFEEAFLQKWTLRPEEVAKKDSAAALYRQLEEDLDKINTLANAGKTGAEIPGVREPVKSLQENLQFLRDLNQVFTYLQLPVRFKDQEARADLYLLARKKALSDKKETLSVLLHLDMKNLGSLNVHIRQNHGRQLQADFYTENTETGRLLRQNLPLLAEALQSKGYTIRAEVKDTYKKPDFVQDFIEQNPQDHLMKRYSFDIRT